jgi:hypothetical protein
VRNTGIEPVTVCSRAGCSPIGPVISSCGHLGRLHGYSLKVVFPQGSIKGVIDLASIRRATGQTQTELAANLGVGQAQVSKIERQDDMLISTLTSYLAALGVEAKLVVQLGDQVVTYDLTARRGKR